MQTLAPPLYAVESRRVGDNLTWAAYTVTPAGGVGPQASPAFDAAHEAEAWARAFGQLADPYLEAA